MARRRSLVRCRTAAAAVLLVAAGSLAGCSGGDDDPGSGTPLDQLKAGPVESDLTVSDADLGNWGYAPLPDRQYKPDVVVVAGGAHSLLWASTEEPQVLIDPAADGADRLEVGKVLFLSASVVGRVAAIEDVPEGRLVDLAPVSLQEVVPDGDLDLDLDLDPSQFRYLVAQDQSDAVEETGAEPATFTRRGGTLSAEPVVNLVAIPRDDHKIPFRQQPNPPPSTADVPPEILAGAISVEPTFAPGKISLALNYNRSGIKLSTQMGLMFNRVQLNQGVASPNDTTGRIGAAGMELSFALGSSEPSAIKKFKVEPKIAANISLPPGPLTAFLPLVVRVTWKTSVEMAFSGANSTLVGDGKWLFKDGEIQTEKSLLDSLSGVTVGVSGAVFATSMKVHVGLGFAGWDAYAVTGPYGILTGAVGVAQGSAIGSPIAVCRQVTVSATGGLGFGVDLEAAERFGLEAGREKTWGLFNATAYANDSPICHDAGSGTGGGGPGAPTPDGAMPDMPDDTAADPIDPDSDWTLGDDPSDPAQPQDGNPGDQPGDGPDDGGDNGPDGDQGNGPNDGQDTPDDPDVDCESPSPFVTQAPDGNYLCSSESPSPA